MISNPLGERKGRSIRGNQGQDGKFQWGSVLANSDTFNNFALDRGDPNYCSDSDVDSTEYPHHVSMLMDMHQDVFKSEAENVKASIVSIVVEYFSSGDMSEVSASLEDLPDGCEMMHYFVKRLILTALDRKEREREMTSHLLNSLYSVIIPPETMKRGFESVIQSLDDTSLDVPDALNLVSFFIARAICDDLLPPSFVSQISSGPDSTNLKTKVEKLLAGPHSKILQCWGLGVSSAQDAKDAIASSLKEFASSHDQGKFSSSLQALSLPFFHHEVVKQAILLAMASPPLRQPLVSLLKHLVFDVLQISQGQLIKGLQRVSSSLADLSLDDPAAAEHYGHVMDAIVVGGLIEEGQRSLVAVQPESGVSTHSLSQFKSLTQSAVREYLLAADLNECVRRLQELDDPGLLHLIVKIMVVMANEKKDSQRELISQLFRHLAMTSVLQPDQFILGFVVLLSQLEDHILDCPDAVRLCSLFLARSIVDGVMSPNALSQILRGLPATCSLGIQVVRSAGAILSDRHSTERLAGCWKLGFYNGQARQLIDVALREFLTTKDKKECGRCLSELGIPLFHHEIVLRAVELSFEHDSAEKTESLVSLLSSLSSSGVVSSTQMTRGFARVKGRMDQAQVDFGPHAVTVFATLVERGVKEGWLEM